MAGKYGPVKNRLLQWGDPETGPLHPHYRRGSGKYAPKFYFPGRCSGTCPGPAARRLNPGDLNDEPEAATTPILYGPPGSEIGTGGFNQPDQGDGQRLWNLAARIPEPERYSRIYRGRRELIDHILASHQVTHAVADGDVTTGPAPESIGDNPNARRDAPGSDRRPVVATINLA